MTEQKQKKEILDGFAPSTGDESYLTKGKDQEFLSELGKGLTSDLTKSAESMLAAGEKLREARKRISGDKEYGAWCRKYAPGVSARVLLNIRAVAEDPQLRKIIKKGHLAFGSVAELISASDKLVEKILESDEPMTVKETREKVKEDKSTTPTSADSETKPETAEEFAASVVSAIDDKLEAIDPGEVTVIDTYALYLQLPVIERVQAFIDTRDPDAHEMEDMMGTNWAFIIFGVADTWEKDEHAPNRDETLARYKSYAKACHPDTGGNPELFTTLNDAKRIVHNYYT